MDRLKELQDMKAKFIEENKKTEYLINELELKKRRLAQAISDISSELNELERHALAQEIKTALDIKYPCGWAVYEVTLSVDYTGMDSHSFIAWSEDDSLEQLEELLEQDALENLNSYGLTSQEQLEELMEEYGYEDEDECIEEMELDVSEYNYLYEEVDLFKLYMEDLLILKSEM